jgi:elongation factor Ts
MIIAASPEVLVVNAEDVPAELLAKERDVEMGKEDLKSKPEAVRWGGFLGNRQGV